MAADLMDHFDTIRILTSTLGYPLFEKIQKPNQGDILTCKGKKALARGEYTEDGLIIFAKSTSNRLEATSIHSYVSAARQRLIDHGILEILDEETLGFTKDQIFPSQVRQRLWFLPGMLMAGRNGSIQMGGHSMKLNVKRRVLTEMGSAPF